jgi:hypothetical protein
MASLRSRWKRGYTFFGDCSPDAVVRAPSLPRQERIAEVLRPTFLAAQGVREESEPRHLFPHLQLKIC